MVGEIIGFLFCAYIIIMLIGGIIELLVGTYRFTVDGDYRKDKVGRFVAGISYSIIYFGLPFLGYFLAVVVILKVLVSFGIVHE